MVDRVLSGLFIALTLFKPGLANAGDVVETRPPGEIQPHSPGCTSMGGSGFGSMPSLYYRARLSTLEYAFADIYGDCPELKKDQGTVRFLIQSTTIQEAAWKIHLERCKHGELTVPQETQLVQATLDQMMRDKFTKANFIGTPESLDLNMLAEHAIEQSNSIHCDKPPQRSNPPQVQDKPPTDAQENRPESFSLDELSEKLKNQ